VRTYCVDAYFVFWLITVERLWLVGLFCTVIDCTRQTRWLMSSRDTWIPLPAGLRVEWATGQVFRPDPFSDVSAGEFYGISIDLAQIHIALFPFSVWSEQGSIAIGRDSGVWHTQVEIPPMYPYLPVSWYLCFKISFCREREGHNTRACQRRWRWFALSHGQ